MNKQMHLIQMFFHTPINHVILTWADKRDGQLDGLQDFSFWQDVAKKLEAACFDGVFFADTPAVHDEYKNRVDASVQYGVAWPTHDPLPLVAVMASATTRLGFGATVSTNGTHPYLLVRRISTLDYLTKGRVAWNIVTGYLRAERRALGSPEVQHDARYDIAEEYMDVCYALWDSVEPGALKKDRSTGIFADPSKVKVVDYHGEHYSCTAVSPTMPSPQGRPVLLQAGSSGRGMSFAVKHADVVFAIQPTMEGMKRFMAQIGDAAEADARKEPVRVVFGVQPILGGTEEEAQRRAKEITDRIPLEAALSRLSGSLGTDLSKFDPDQPLDKLTTGSHVSQGVVQAALSSKAKTLRELALNRSHFPRLIGTPEQVADRLESIWRETGAHGFNISPTTNPGSVVEFAELVVPILQKRGIFRKEYSGATLRENLLG